MNLCQAGQGAGSHHAQVIGNLIEGYGNRAHGAGEFHQAIAGSLGLKVVFRFLQFLHAGELLKLLGDLGAEVGGGIQAGAGGGTADGQLAQTRQGGLDAFDTQLDLAGVAAEFLAQGNRGGIHQVGAAGLDHISEFLGLLGQGLVEDFQARDEVINGSFRSSHVRSGGEGVIGRLAHVYVVIRVNFHAIVMRQGGDDLIGVHIG